MGRGSSGQGLGGKVFIIVATSSSVASLWAASGELGTRSESEFATIKGETGAGLPSCTSALICLILPGKYEENLDTSSFKDE